jgi:SAM-dependent methyltransferase
MAANYQRYLTPGLPGVEGHPQEAAGARRSASAPYSSWMRGSRPVRESVWDRLAPAYGNVEPDHFAEFAWRLVQLVQVAPAAAVLDLACGAGAVASVVTAAAPSARLAAVDLSADMLRRAADDIFSHRGFGMAAMNAQSLAFRGRVFDMVLCGSALDSFLDPGQAVAEAYRVLRPAGILGLWVAPRWWWQGDARWDWHDHLVADLGVDVGNVPPELGGPRALGELIQAAGFHDMQVRVDVLGLRFPDASGWWRWAWSHGFRQVLERLSCDQLTLYRDTAFEQIGNAGIDGRMEALIATAARPED